MPTRRTRTSGCEVSGSLLTLGDLRWLVKECEGLPDEASVTVQEYKSFGSPTDWNDAKISVKGTVT